MRRRLLLLNLVLVALASAAAWQLRVRWLDGKAREHRLAASVVKPAARVAIEPARPPQPASAVTYGDVAQKVLFSRDRNPTVTVQAAPVKPVPAMPVLYGVMDLGGGPVVILSEKAGGTNRGYSVGEKVGVFTLVAVESEELVLGWEGQEIRKKFQDLRPQPGTPAPQAATGAPAATPGAVVQSASAPVEAGPGPQVTANMRACVAGDTSPAGTVKDGYRKVMTQTPFGSNCRWDPVK